MKVFPQMGNEAALTRSGGTLAAHGPRVLRSQLAGRCLHPGVSPLQHS